MCECVCEETEGFLMKAVSCVAWLELKGSMPKHVQCGSGENISGPVRMEFWRYYCLCEFNLILFPFHFASHTLIKDVTTFFDAQVLGRTSGQELVETLLI